MIKKPDEILASSFARENEIPQNVFIKQEENQKFAIIVNTENERPRLSSELTEKEYNHLKFTKKIDLFDLCRDSQTFIMKDKSIFEADIITRAQTDGYLAEFDDVTRPFNQAKSKSNCDFIGEIYPLNSIIEIEIKGLKDNIRHKRPLHVQAEDIHSNINKRKF